MFHNVLSVFDDVLLVVHDLSQCFKSVSWCFTMFNNILGCLVSLATIGIYASAAADRVRDRNNAARIGNDTAGIVAIAAKVILF